MSFANDADVTDNMRCKRDSRQTCEHASSCHWKVAFESYCYEVNGSGSFCCIHVATIVQGLKQLLCRHHSSRQMTTCEEVTAQQ